VLVRGTAVGEGSTGPYAELIPGSSSESSIRIHSRGSKGSGAAEEQKTEEHMSRGAQESTEAHLLWSE
jgi:hypothetical protein